MILNPSIRPGNLVNLWDYTGDLSKIRYPKYGLNNPLFKREFIDWAQDKVTIVVFNYDNEKQGIESVNCTQSVLYGPGRQFLDFKTSDDFLLFKLTWM